MSLSWRGSAGSSPSQAGHVSGPRTTGIRLWSSAHSSFGGQVTIAKLLTHSLAGERQFSEPGQRHQSPVSQRDGVGLLARRGLLPLVKVIDRHEAATPLECLAEGGPVLDPLGL